MNSSIRVCHLCSAHSVDDDRVFARECVSLARAGYEVHLFASGSNDAVFENRGVVIHPLPQISSRVKRFMRGSRVAATAAELKPDLFHVHEPELLGPVVKVSGKTPVIWDVHESYLDVIDNRFWIPKMVRPAVRLAWDWRERRLVRRCAAVIPVTEWVAQRYNSMGIRSRIIANFPDLSAWRELPTLPRDGRTCVYTGLISRIRGLLEVVQAIGILKRRGLEIKLVLAGPDVDNHVASLRSEARKQDVEHLVEYHGILSRYDARMLAHSAGIAVLPYLPLGNNMAGWPTKMFQCMAHGLPLVYSDFPSYRQVADSSGAGIAIDPTSPESISDALYTLARNPELAREMGEAGRRAVYERFSWEQEEPKLLMLYREVLRDHKSRAKSGAEMPKL